MEIEVMSRLHRGMTEIDGNGLFTGEEVRVLIVYISKFEYSRLRGIIRAHDPNAFIVETTGVRIDGKFRSLSARSERPCRTDHTSLSDLMDVIQNEFRFEDISGTLVCIYYPDYMDGLNAAGWHLHFVSEDRLKGGHVMGLEMLDGTVYITKINSIEVRLPDEPAFDTYSLKNASADEIKKIEQGSK